MGIKKIEIPWLSFRDISVLVFILDGLLRRIPITQEIPWLREISEFLSFISVIFLVVRMSHTNKYLGYLMALAFIGLVLYGYFPFVSSFLPV